MRQFSPPSRWLRSFYRTLILALLAMAFCVIPARAQTVNSAEVILDGQPIFLVSDSGQFGAQERADFVNYQLQEIVQSDVPLKVTVEQRNQFPALFINDRYLLTVTERDALPGTTPQKQAERWVEEIQTAAQQAQKERSQSYLKTITILSGAIILGTITIFFVLGWLQRDLLIFVKTKLSLGNQDSIPKGLDLLFSLLLAIARFSTGMVAILYIANLYPVSRALSYQIRNILLSSFSAPILTLDKKAYSVTDLLILTVMLFGLVLLSRLTTNLLRRRVLGLAGLNRGAQEAIAVIAQYSLIFLGALVLLQIWGLDLSSLAILASALGIGVGIGLQNIAKNFGSGLILIFERPIEVGDFVEVGTLNGTVEKIGARSTEIRTLDRVSIIVPNSHFVENEVINWSHGNAISRLHLSVDVAYGSDPNEVRTALIDAALIQAKVLTTLQPQVFFKGFGESALQFELLVWTAEPEKQFSLKSDLYFSIYAILHQRKIEIPFPQYDLHLRSGQITLSAKMEAALESFIDQMSHPAQRP